MPFDGTPPQEAVTEQLVEARAKVAVGWCQHVAWRTARRCWPLQPWKQYCLVGALGVPVPAAAISCLYAALRGVAGDAPGAPPIAGLMAFNDAPGRTQAEVLAVYDAAIALSRGELQ